MAKTPPTYTTSYGQEAKILGLFYCDSWNLWGALPHDVVVSDHTLSSVKVAISIKTDYFDRFLDTFNHPTAHWCFTFTFMIFIAISSFSQIIEVFLLHKEYPDRAHLKRNAALKFSIVSISTGLGIVFGILYLTCGGKPTTARGNLLLSASAICEWSVSFLLTLYFTTFALDFWPATKTSSRFQDQIDSRFTTERGNSYDFDSKLHSEKLDQDIYETQSLKGRDKRISCPRRIVVAYLVFKFVTLSLIEYTMNTKPLEAHV
ncbi:hypothetical protein PSTG_11624 [Puccinia striiformis f. sp. tritici PST-78]|uniref:CWH43-like N-terminal domain-containing protein n=1 Tax=Puccinia striiformis f. sp. tritici PST-78 TaxID=1165861 RepID=A0A0L0V6Y7_9BASI|nr:hypothetical protein PSTG_11624 [Puccinia striiformis f. sp. tritici PST-78]